MRLVAIALLTFPALAQAQVLRADAILCETEPPLAMLSESHLAHKPGSVVMQGISAQLKYHEWNVLHQQRVVGIWNEERALTRNRSRSTDSRVSDAREQARESADEAKRYAEFKSRCMATPNQEQPLTIIERRPISGVARVRTMLRGNEHEFWTVDFYLK